MIQKSCNATVLRNMKLHKYLFTGQDSDQICMYSSRFLDFNPCLAELINQTHPFVTGNQPDYPMQILLHIHKVNATV